MAPVSKWIRIEVIGDHRPSDKQDPGSSTSRTSPGTNRHHSALDTPNPDETSSLQVCMNLREAIQWLDERGGRWCVRASAAACIVVATVGALRVEVPAARLNVSAVDCALVNAVLELSTLQRAFA